MPKVLFFADPSNGRPGLGATIRLDSGEPCLISIAQTGVRVKKTRFGFLGPVLYSEKNVCRAAATAEALSERFPNNLLPTEFINPVLRAFANAVLHCSTCAEVAVTLNQALGTVQVQGRGAPPTEAGTTPESAIRIHATNSLEGIPKEYAVLDGMFGTPNRDWKLIERLVVNADDGRTLEKFTVSALNKRKEIYFDVTDWFMGNTSREKTALENLILSRDKLLMVLLPKGEFVTLFTGLLKLTDAQLSQIGLTQIDRKKMLDPFADAMIPWHGNYEMVPEHVSVTTLMSVWSKIIGLLASWQPANLLQEEELENLKAIIGGTMKDARR
jgi:hypothetical protein